MMSYLEALEETIAIWTNGKNEDEWLFENFRKSEIGTLDSSEAFSLINETVPILLDTSNGDVWTELFETIICLARKSETTEVPTKVIGNWDKIREIAYSHGQYDVSKFEELARYYRL